MNKYWFILILILLLPFIPYMWKLIMIDKIFCPWWYGVTCSTDSLGPWLEATFGSILALLVLKKA